MKTARCLILLSFLALFFTEKTWAQCGGIMEPGFQFLTSSRGCAPYTVSLETHYLSSVPGTVYYASWGDGSPVETFTQSNATGVIMTHMYPNTSIDCGYDLTIDASNACNPKGSVVPINTQVIVWTNDVVSINPQVFRVCQGFAESLSFTDNSDWNCFPRATRENSDPRWIQWIYGTGPAATQIPGVQINAATPGSFPYLDPGVNRNPIYPVTSPGQISLPISVPITTLADIGKEFDVTLKNWNQCNAYDNDLTDGNPFNPVSGNLVNGDNVPQTISARIVIVPSPQPSFITRLGNAGGVLQSIFCIGDNIFFDDQTPSIAGASFGYTWQFFDNNTGTGTPLSTSTSSAPVFAYLSGGQKLIRLSVTDNNAAGGCVSTFDGLVTISPSLIAKIQTSDLLNNLITPYFCQQATAPFTTFQVRFTDVSVGVVTATTQWRWEFYNENGVLVMQAPSSGFSSVALGPFDQSFINPGLYRVRLIIGDNLTGCQTQDEVQVRVYEKPVPFFSDTPACEGQPNTFTESSTLQSINGESIVLREWDFNYSGITFNKDPAYDNQLSFSRLLGVAGTYPVALRVTADQNGCSDIFVLPAVVDPLPLASFTADVTAGCSPLTVNFTNSSIASQPDGVDRYIWEVDEKQGLGFQPIATQHPTDPGFSNTFQHQFENTLTTNKSFDVRLRVVTVHGCETISGPATITVYPGTKSGFIEANYSPFNNNCSPQSITFNVDAQTQTLKPTDYTWTIGDVNGVVYSSSTGTTPLFNFNFTNPTESIKDFSVKLTTTLPSSCFGDSTRTIRIEPVPSSQFTIDTLQFDCQIMKLNLSATQKGLSAYHWMVSENGTVVGEVTGTNDQFAFTFNRTAANSVVQFSLDTKNFASCGSPVTTSTITVPMLDNMNVSFTASPASQSLPSSTVIITNTTSAGPWSYVWDFGDGATSNDPTITSHTYAGYGKYTITLTVKSNVCVQSQTQEITILAIPPIVDFAFAPPFGCAPLTVQFTNLTQFADPSTYHWDFGDGGTSLAANPTYTYFNPGTYSVSLSASNTTGQTITAVKQSIIDVFVKPMANFKITPPLLYIPGGILYTSNLSTNATGFYWDFGDGQTSTDFRPEHAYKRDGTFTITLAASNESGCSDTIRLVDAVIVKKGNEVLVPNAFSPGTNGAGYGDGHNDVFLPIMRGVTQFEMLIFNRWGQLLFESRDQSTGWDGYYQGKLCQQDVYMYKLSVKLENGENVVRIGDVNLIR